MCDLLLILIIVIALLALIFRKKLHATEDKMREVANLDNTKTITDKNLMIRSLIVLGLVILGFVTHDITHIETCVAAMLGASVLLLFEKPTNTFSAAGETPIIFTVAQITAASKKIVNYVKKNKKLPNKYRTCVLDIFLKFYKIAIV